MTAGFADLPYRWRVRRFVPIMRHGGRRLKESQWREGPGIGALDADGRDYTVDRIIVDRVLTPPALAAGLGDGPVIERSRRYLLEGTPVMLATSWYPYELARGTAIEHQDTGPGGALARLAEAGHVARHFTETITTRLPSDAETEALWSPPTVFGITRHAADRDGRVIEVSVMVLHGTQYTLEYVLDA